VVPVNDPHLLLILYSLFATKLVTCTLYQAAGRGAENCRGVGAEATRRRGTASC